jgi:CRP-like cAMP-binding protein
MDLKELLRGFEGFGELTESELERMAAIAELRSAKAGSTIDVQGEPAKMFGVLVSGRLGVMLSLDLGVVHQTYQVTTVGPGEMFAWSGMVGNPFYTAGSKCLTDCQYLAFDAAKLQEEFERDPRLGYVIMKLVAKTIASRLRHMQLKLVQQYALSESAE